MLKPFSQIAYEGTWNYIQGNRPIIQMNKWLNILKYNPIPSLLESNNPAILSFAQRDLLEETVLIEDLWQLPDPQKILKGSARVLARIHIPVLVYWFDLCSRQHFSFRIFKNRASNWKSIRIVYQKPAQEWIVGVKNIEGSKQRRSPVMVSFSDMQDA